MIRRWGVTKGRNNVLKGPNGCVTLRILNLLLTLRAFLRLEAYLTAYPFHGVASAVCNHAKRRSLGWGRCR